MNYSIEDIKNYWQYVNDDILQEYKIFKEKSKNLIENEKYDFNIIELISDKYYKENFHSDIVAKLLENKVVLKNFLEFIEVDNNSYLENVEIKREKYRIDILIKTKTNCIIIENKLNGAIDQENQLNRYYNSCIESGLNVDKIVYLSPSENQQPNENSKKDIPEYLLKTIYGYDGEGDDFYTQVIKKSFDNFSHTTNKEWIILAEHYLKILKRTGIPNMNELTDNFLNTIIDNPKEYEKIQCIVDMYNNLTLSRVNRYIKKFGGKNYNNVTCFLEFKSLKTDKIYVIDIYAKDYNTTSLMLFTREEDIEKYNEDNKNIEAWLKKHNSFNNFNCGNYDWNRWTRDFKFPEEENELYDVIKNLKNQLEKDIKEYL